MDISIRLAKIDDLKDYTNLLQKTYQDAYTNNSIGLYKSCFSKKIFLQIGVQNYLKAGLKQGLKQRTWLAFMGGMLVGSITVINTGKECKLRGFYVATEFQGKGIGKRLFRFALKFSKNKDIVLDLYAHVTKSIKMYKWWGFEIDTSKRVFYRHWPQWPKGLRVKCFYMRLSNKTSNI